MKCVLFYHAFTSCWNNGNAHFLRGVARELASLGHEVVVYEPADGWSRSNALADGGADALAEVTELFSDVTIRAYQPGLDLDHALDGADLVLVHEWNPPELIAEIGRRRAGGACYFGGGPCYFGTPSRARRWHGRRYRRQTPRPPR